MEETIPFGLREAKEEMSLEELFQVYYRRVYNFIYYKVNHRQTTEDLLSLTFEKIIKNQGQYSGKKGSQEVWIFTIARNVVYDHFRKERKTAFSSFDELPEPVSEEASPLSVILQGERKELLLRAIRALNDQEQTMVALKFGGGLRNQELATVLGMTENAVGVKLYRIMKKLREWMEKEGFQYEE